MKEKLEHFEKIREALLASAGEDTAYDKNAYLWRTSPLSEHWGAVAYAIQQKLGGDILTGRVNGEKHFWNKLPNGQEVDFASCQYPGGDGINHLDIKGKLMPKRKTVNKIFAIFNDRFQKNLAIVLNEGV